MPSKAPSEDMMQDIATRFVLTAPAEQLLNFEGLMFLVESAWWYYEDHVREQRSELNSYNLKDFATLLFDSCEDLRKHVGSIEDIMERFKAFKRNVPTRGGILLDGSMERVLLVRQYNGQSWGFPKGKINTNETDMECAVREVLEETGWDLEGQLSEADCLEIVVGAGGYPGSGGGAPPAPTTKRDKLYIIAGLDPDIAVFAPKCKGEIGAYAWHRIVDLPSSKEAAGQTYYAEDGTKHRFWGVWPYMKGLKKWIHLKKREQAQAANALPLPAGPARPGGGLPAGATPPAQGATPSRQLQLPFATPHQQQHPQTPQAGTPVAMSSSLAALFSNAAKQQQKQRLVQQQAQQAPPPQQAPRPPRSAPSAPLPPTLTDFAFDRQAIMRALTASAQH